MTDTAPFTLPPAMATALAAVPAGPQAGDDRAVIVIVADGPSVTGHDANAGVTAMLALIDTLGADRARSSVASSVASASIVFTATQLADLLAQAQA